MRVQPSKSRRLPPVVGPIERPRPAACCPRGGPRRGRLVCVRCGGGLGFADGRHRDEFSRPRGAGPSQRSVLRGPMGPPNDWGSDRLEREFRGPLDPRGRRRYRRLVDPAGHPSEHVDEPGGWHARARFRRWRLEPDGRRPVGTSLPRDRRGRRHRRDHGQRPGHRGHRADQRHRGPGLGPQRSRFLVQHLAGDPLGRGPRRPGDQPLLGTNETFIGPTDIQLAVDYAWSKGALIVAAAGNSGVGTLDYPARLPNVVSVAAIDESGRRASFSNYGSGLDISAPGTRIVTLNGGNNQPNNVHYLRGTSFSTPFVSGAAALLLSVDPSLTNVELWNILNSTAVQPVGSGYNTNYGWGVVNVWNAINALSQPFISVNSFRGRSRPARRSGSHGRS